MLYDSPLEFLLFKTITLLFHFVFQFWGCEGYTWKAIGHDRENAVSILSLFHTCQKGWPQLTHKGTILTSRFANLCDFLFFEFPVLKVSTFHLYFNLPAVHLVESLTTVYDSELTALKQSHIKAEVGKRNSPAICVWLQTTISTTSTFQHDNQSLWELLHSAYCLVVNSLDSGYHSFEMLLLPCIENGCLRPT